MHFGDDWRGRRRMSLDFASALFPLGVLPYIRRNVSSAFGVQTFLHSDFIAFRLSCIQTSNSMPEHIRSPTCLLFVSKHCCCLDLSSTGPRHVRVDMSLSHDAIFDPRLRH
jgi:hypothetical protein